MVDKKATFDLGFKGQGHSDLILVRDTQPVLMHICTKYHGGTL